MNKKVIYFLLLLFFISLIIVLFDKDDRSKNVSDEETRAVYFSYIEFSNYITDKSDSEQKKNIITILNNIKSLNFNRIIVHVRPFSDSIYVSNYYPISQYVLNDKGKYPSYDILKFFIDEAHKRNIKFDAWINPYRISNLKNPSSLSFNSIYFKYKDTDMLGVTESGIYFNPASSNAQQLIINGIIEIVKNYNIDGIHFDDYFYPDKEIDLKNYDAYLVNGGTLSLNDYRLKNVKDLIKNVYSSIKTINSNVEFGIAPQGNIDNCYEESFLDVKEILSQDGYIDYIMPQIYFGFLNQYRPFKKTLNEWSNLIKTSNIKLIPALAFYKVGNYDKYALNGSNEWMMYDNVISKEIDYSRKNNKYKGFSLFSYNYMFNDKYKNDKTKIELNNIINICKNID